ncbi:phage holin family protein [Microbispora hainanensis]|uniref:Phage holin family protein n=1 Tax=Microbispora hainanensis TaxID=568844 RepID=A0ABZ1SJX5_9ACTN|nr:MULTISPECIES: phage holin family protein [Microbispora]NJP25403.1 phage holin family protein [Microbispora sp. CL1-1]TQS13375.1 phage holin family protein [Microbispora sp. SCL1-1]
MPEDESLGALVAQASHHISTLVRSEIELAKAELKFDAKRVGVAAGLFGAAAFMGHLCLILASFAIAYALVAVGLATWLAFTIVTVFYLVVAGLLVLVGYRRLKGLTGMKRTRRSLRGLAGPEEAEDGLPERVPAPAARPAAPAPPPYTGPTAGQVGAHRESVSDAG